MKDKDVDTGSKRIYRQPLNYENGIILPKIRDISIWRDQDVKLYESGVITLMLLLPKDLRHNTLKWWNHGTGHEDLTGDGKKDFDDLFVYILETLEHNNIVYPSITFELGHD